MKKLLFLLPILAIASIGISGCQEKKELPRITYGTLVNENAEEITYEDLTAKIARQETMIVATYLGVSSGQCGCWIAFKGVLDEYVKEYKTRVYYIDRFSFPEDEDNFGITLNTKVTDPSVVFFKNGKKANQYLYSNDTKPMFEKMSGFRKAVEKFARDPQLMFVDQEYLDNALFTEKNDKVVVYYLWNTCPDCNDCLPYVLDPYQNNNKFSSQIWCIDLAIKGLLLDNDGKQDKTQPGYIKFLKDHHMSADGDATFGYDRGFVPTFQIWEKGELKDMSVYFNDSVEKVGEEYQITRSFYSEERIANLKYTNTVLQETIIPNEDMNFVEWNGSTFAMWKTEAARKLHQPLLEAFLDMYVK